MSGEPELLSWLVLEAIGRPLRAFFRWLDNQPHRDPSQISTLHRAGRLALGFGISLSVLAPLGWLIFR